MPLSHEHMRDAANRYFAAWTSLDPSAYVAAFAADASVYDPYGSTPHQGAEALRKFFTGIANALQEVRIEADTIHTAGNRAAVEFRGKAIGKNGKPVEVVGIDVFEFNEAGLITALWAYWDSAAVLAQLRR
ncbi:nuclear transport factor 2 family protein [Nitrospira moscoviensis]|uniref:Putative Steroid Delta-isomerase n=1 Tax=Nitrospira moscoviensis TaxID=42253 RepID=A0A0K2GE06_NITMO|nr:nuclear transport factor 2 family protein [Nitrospira moscoviensis]ALA58837.1 putative Steroid Delta-isomerase [Nitrospira moscoviensis]